MSVEKRKALERSRGGDELIFCVDQSGLRGQVKNEIKGQLLGAIRSGFSWATVRRFLDWFSEERKKYSDAEGEKMAGLYFDLREELQNLVVKRRGR